MLLGALFFGRWEKDTEKEFKAKLKRIKAACGENKPGAGRLIDG
jgi:hypothetical protein